MSAGTIGPDILDATPTTTTRLTSVDQMRTFAAFLVVFSHSYFWIQKTAVVLGTSFTLPIFKQGYGAIVFMCLSGYLLTHISYTKFGRRGGAEFVVRRLARIAPLYWLFTSVFIILLLLSPSAATKNSMSWANTLGSYMFLPTPRPFDGAIKPVFSSGWTLNYIVLFYLVLGLSLRLSRYRALLMICAVYTVLALVHPLMADYPPLAFWSGKYGLLFMAGAIAAFAAKAAGGRVVASSPVLALCAVLATGSWFFEAPWIVVVVSTASMFAVASLVKPSAAPATRRRWAQLGDISYSVILSHPFVIGMLSKLFIALAVGRYLPVWTLLPISLATAFIVGATVYRMLERPLTRRIRGWLDRWFLQPPASGAPARSGQRPKEGGAARFVRPARH